ncbi:MAG: hypothetical protein RIB93_06725 [Coleofasciculus sp. D1-CHI-01]|uniref:hypothetical protein n=1 Tax=Coleofasciculus sp. D1-CHI-01 TaxID=3068482 RepID=UPI0032FF7B4E
MNVNEQVLLNRVEALRIPLEDPALPLDWKDWYHFILLDLKTGIRLLVNATLIGKPEQGQMQVSFIVNLPSAQITPELESPPSVATFGTTFSLDWQPDMVCRHPLRLQGKGINLEINGMNSSVQVHDERAQLSLNVQGQAEAMPLLVTEDAPFGSGFIGWGLIPGLKVSGELSVCGRSFAIDRDWFCYHDRNFGRFRWGEDIGWEWFVAYVTDKKGRSFTLVLDKRTNKNHSMSGLPYIFIYSGTRLRKVFLGATLQIDWDWSATPSLPLRLPGIMASLFGDRTVSMPRQLQVQAADDQDQLLLTMAFDSTSELIVPDNQSRQYTFIEEVTGAVDVTLVLQGETIPARGFAYGEYVH